MEFGTLDMLIKCGKQFRHERMRERGLSETECMLCSFAYAHPGCSQDDASRGLMIDKTTVAKAMLTLERKGLIEREQNGEDRRRKSLRLTERGQERVSAVIGLHDRWMKEVLSCLEPQEQAQFEEYCRRLQRRAEEMLRRGEGTDASAREKEETEKGESD